MIFTETLEEEIKTAIRVSIHEFRSEFPDTYKELEAAWNANTTKKSVQGAKRLIPFIGSDFDYFAISGTLNWPKLIEYAYEIMGEELGYRHKVLWSKHELETTDLSDSEKLFILLSTLKDENSKKMIVKKFDEFFTNLKPSDLHKRIVNIFPHIITTNYHQILTQAGDAENLPTVIDLTDPTFFTGLKGLSDLDHQEALKCVKERLFGEEKTIIHLHGCYYANEESEDRKISRIFSGIDPHGVSVPGPMLIFTKVQYHKMFQKEKEFKFASFGLFSEQNLLLFMGSGFPRNEIRISWFLRDLVRSDNAESLGIYVGFDLNPAQIEYLKHERLAVIHLPSKFGWSPLTRKYIWHLFFDVLEDYFGKIPNKVVSHNRVSFPITEIPKPEILCVGLSSREVVLFLDKQFGYEMSVTVPKSHLVEEAAGQHLVPAYYLACKGRRVALATRLGNDEDGEWVMQYIRSKVESLKRGDIDTRLVIRSAEGLVTLRTFVITYPKESKGNLEVFENKTIGARTIFDYEGHENGGQIDWLEDRCEYRETFRRELSNFKGIRALYLGIYGLDVQKLVLQELGMMNQFRFFETGTKGAKDQEKDRDTQYVASQCTHILASAEFTIRMAAQYAAKNDPNYIKYPADTLDHDYQKEAYEKIQRIRDCSPISPNFDPKLLIYAYKEIFGENKNSCYVITLGVYGSAFYNPQNEPESDFMPLKENIPGDEQVAWVHCGDIFRAAFIQAILEGKSVKEACVSGNTVAFKRTTRLNYFLDCDSE